MSELRQPHARNTLLSAQQTLRATSVRSRHVAGRAAGVVRRHGTRTLNLIERRGFPVVIAYMIHVVTITFDLLLIPLLILFKDQVVLVLVANSYLNAMSVATSSMVMRQEIQEKSPQARRHKEVVAHHTAHHTAHDTRLDRIEQQLERVLSAVQLPLPSERARQRRYHTNEPA